VWHSNEWYAVNRFSSGCKYSDLIFRFRVEPKINFRSLASTNPTSLSIFYDIGPLVKPIQTLQHFFSVGPDIKPPLVQLPLFDYCPRSPTTTILVNLFVCENSLINWIPVNESWFLICQPSVQHLEEDLLSVLVVLRLARANLFRPVKLKPETI